MLKSKKTFFSFLLILTFIFNFSITSFALGDRVESVTTNNRKLIQNIIDESKDIEVQYPDLKKVNQKIISLLEQGYTQDQVKEQLSDSEFQILIDTYRGFHGKSLNSTETLKQSMVENFESESEMDVYIRRVEGLASYYQDYYEKNGHFPLESEGIQTMATTYDPSLVKLGYYVTEQALAQQLATLGILCSATFPYLALITFLVGVTLLADVVFDYYGNSTAVDNQIITWYKNSQTRARFTSTSSIEFVVQAVVYKNLYWRAHLTDFQGFGGLTVDTPMSLSSAAAWLGLNGVNTNTYTIKFGDAYTAALTAGDGSALPAHDPVKYLERPLNKPHFHGYRNGIRMNSHSFYGVL